MVGAHNDISVLQRSPVFSRLANGQALECNFEINGHQYNMGYYLTDAIYTTYSIFVKTNRNPGPPTKKYFSKKQESARKDVERAFGVLQAQFAVVGYHSLSWTVEQMWEIMNVCVSCTI